MMALIKKYGTRGIYQTDSLSYHYSLITPAECNIEWMSMFHCILNWLQWNGSRPQPDTWLVNILFSRVIYLFFIFFAAALRSRLGWCQMPGRCPSVAFCLLPFNPIGCDIARPCLQQHILVFFFGFFFLWKVITDVCAKTPASACNYVDIFSLMSLHRRRSSISRAPMHPPPFISGTAAVLVDVYLAA